MNSPSFRIRLTFSPDTNTLTGLDLEGTNMPLQTVEVLQEADRPGDVTIYVNDATDPPDEDDESDLYPSSHKLKVDELFKGLPKFKTFCYPDLSGSFLGIENLSKWGVWDIAKDFAVNDIITSKVADKNKTTVPGAEATFNTVVQFRGKPRDKFDLKEVTTVLSIYMRGSPTHEYIAKVFAKAARGEFVRVRCSYKHSVDKIVEELTKCGFDHISTFPDTVDVPDLDFEPAPTKDMRSVKFERITHYSNGWQDEVIGLLNRDCAFKHNSTAIRNIVARSAYESQTVQCFNNHAAQCLRTALAKVGCVAEVVETV